LWLRISYINRTSATNLPKPATAKLTDVLQLTPRKLLSCIHCSKHTKILLQNMTVARQHVGLYIMWLYINTSNKNDYLKINNYFNPFAAIDFQLCAHSSNFPLIAICGKREIHTCTISLYQWERWCNVLDSRHECWQSNKRWRHMLVTPSKEVNTKTYLRQQLTGQCLLWGQDHTIFRPRHPRARLSQVQNDKWN